MNFGPISRRSGFPEGMNNVDMPKVSEGFYRSLFNSAPALLLVLDPSGKIKECNSRGNDILGYGSGNLSGKKLTKIVHPKYRNKVKDKFNQPGGFSGPYDSYVELVDSEGRKIRGNFKLRELSSDRAEKNQVLLLFEKITERQLENMETKLKRLKKKNKDLEELTTVISHDLREPIRSIGSYIDLLLDRHSDELTDKSSDRLKSIKSNALRIETLMDELARISSLNTDNSLQLLNVPRIVRRITKELTDRGKKFEVNIQEDYPRVHFDPESMEILLQNLISNSVEFNEAPKRIEVGYQRTESDRDFVLFVRDNGKGIPEEYHAKIFETFETLGLPDKGGKRGVGLAISQRIVEENGGEIWLDSEKGEGTTVYFTVPIYEDPKEASTQVPQLSFLPGSKPDSSDSDIELIDQETGLHNRRYFNQKLSVHLKNYSKNGHELKLLLVRPNNFDKLKSRYDEAKTSKTMKKLSDLFKKTVRQSDLILRFSEKQFLFVLPGMASDVERIRKRINAQISDLKEYLPVSEEILTLSFGSTLLEAGEEPDLDEALKEAERDLY